ncbi:MAG: hypothetical protein ACYDD4_13070 [Acidimicrobiales bacterium]
MRRRDGDDEGGFVFVEVVVAAVVLLISVVAVGGQIGTQFLSISTSADQQAATALMSQAMEEVRALPYTFVSTGLSLTDSTVVDDQYITINGSTCTTNDTAIWNPAEVIPCAAPSTETQAPFVPHTATTTEDGTSFSVSAYPSIDSADTGSGPDVYRVTVVVSWHSSQPGPTKLVAETLVYSAASGCLTDTNHPFAAPCQPFLYGGASAGGGIIDVLPDTASGNPVITGDTFDSVELILTSASSDEQIEQVSTVFGAAETSGGQIEDTSTEATGSDKASSTADNDPGTASNASNTGSVTQSGSVLTLAGNGANANWISVVPGSSDTGATTSTASASSSPPCTDLNGALQTTRLPCGDSNVSAQGTAASLSMGLYAEASSLGTAPLASIAEQPLAYPDESFVMRATSSGGSYCSSTSGDGCVHAAAQESLGTVEIGGLPSQFVSDNAVPANWGTASSNCPTGNYLVALTNFSASASSESGTSAGLPSTAVPVTGASTPYLCYWTSAGYAAVPATWGTSVPSVTFPTVSITDSSVASGPVTVTMTPTLELQATSTSVSLPSSCSSVCTAQASVPSPVAGDIVYTVSQGGTSIADLDIHVDLGSLLLQTSYQAAP